jgi:hypothetical protein
MKIGDKVRVKHEEAVIPEYINKQGFIIDVLKNGDVLVRFDSGIDSEVKTFASDEVYVIWEKQ